MNRSRCASRLGRFQHHQGRGLRAWHRCKRDALVERHEGTPVFNGKRQQVGVGDVAPGEQFAPRHQMPSASRRALTWSLLTITPRAAKGLKPLTAGAAGCASTRAVRASRALPSYLRATTLWVNWGQTPILPTLFWGSLQ